MVLHLLVFDDLSRFKEYQSDIFVTRASLGFVRFIPFIWTELCVFSERAQQACMPPARPTSAGAGIRHPDEERFVGFCAAKFPFFSFFPPCKLWKKVTTHSLVGAPGVALPCLLEVTESAHRRFTSSPPFIYLLDDSSSSSSSSSLLLY